MRKKDVLHTVHRGLMGLILTSFIGMSQNLSPSDLSTCKEYYFTMHDGVGLATDVCLPILKNDLYLPPFQISVFGTPVNVNSLRIARAGQQIFWIPGQPNPWQLPAVFTRTPYGKDGFIAQHNLVNLLGVMSIVQDTRGRYRSEGVYLSMYSDSWDKTPYVPAGWHHPLDITGGQANTHTDGYDSYLYIRDSLVWYYTDTINYPPVMHISNGELAMVGGSAMGNTQYQAAATGTTGIVKALFPIVSSGEQWIMGHMNGLFRERLITGWLGGMYLGYNWVPGPSDPFDSIHTLADFPAPYNASPVTLWLKAVDFWSEDNDVHHPGSFARSAMDVSKAPLQNGESRYTNLNLPIYNLVGWWDIYNYAQIQAWLSTRQHSDTARFFQKLIIGPWAHQTIGMTTTGDMTYPDNVYEVLGTEWSKINSPDVNIPKLIASEPIQWFRTWLSEPHFVLLPQDDWQFATIYNGDSVFVQVPADTYSVAYHVFFNFLNGVGGLPGIPIRIKGIPFVDSNTIQYIDIDPTGTSVFGDTTGTVLGPTNVNFDERDPDGVPPLRIYIAGPDDGTVGNWWLADDTFPPRGVQLFDLYFHPDGTLQPVPPEDSALFSFFCDPKNPVRTIGGPNMIVKVPDGSRYSQGQMLMNDPAWEHLTYPPDTVLPSGDTFAQMLVFETGHISDSVTIAGWATFEFWGGGYPIDNVVTDSLDMDFILRVIDVYLDGREYYVFEGVVNGRAREYARLFAKDDPNADNIPFSNLASNELYYFKLRSFPIGYTFGPGHKIKIVITGNNYDLYQSNPHIPLEGNEFFRVFVRDMDTATYYFHGTAVKTRPAVQQFLVSPSRPAKATLPVLGTPTVPTLVSTQIPDNTAPYHIFAKGKDIIVNWYGSSKSTITIFNPDGKAIASQQLRRGVNIISVGPHTSICLWQITDAKSMRTYSGKILVTEF
ncbi:MAG: hypothetical protein GXO48_04795 [Chlorobi bacterium]|nr:hypothetical protein [Chlorobiota bacterium]